MLNRHPRRALCVLLGAVVIGAGCKPAAGPAPSETSRGAAAASSESAPAAPQAIAEPATPQATASAEAPAIAASASAHADTKSTGSPASAAPRPPANPATLQEAAETIDLRTFPAPEHEEVLHRLVARAGYRLSKPDFAKDAAFYRDKLEGAGWKQISEDINTEKGYAAARYTKDGYQVAVDIIKDPNNGRINAFIENQGNVDAGTLPRIAGAVPGQAFFTWANYSVDAGKDDVIAFVLKELRGAGWRRVVVPSSAPVDDDDAEAWLQFVQNGTRLSVHIAKRDSSTEMTYSTSLCKYELPPLLAPTTASIQWMDEPLLHCFYATKSSPEEVLQFYRRELPARGWAVAGDSKTLSGGEIRVALQGPDKEPMRLDVLSKEGLCFVLLASAEE